MGEHHCVSAGMKPAANGLKDYIHMFLRSELWPPFLALKVVAFRPSVREWAP
jgi:hypothetical protein